ncbi:DUF4190 domain-containing protein [Micromonospora cremea]|uniref:DUF4190 domain-containing protein n=1 Tax=Micromonospora cremea TaxID=709881 RepID=UPI001180C361|nr:DUF4190 domain-containing protein [Micromonospora cremea]
MPAPATPASPGPYPPIGYPPAHIVVHGPPTSGLAVASLVLGILGVLGGWCLFGVPCLLAVVLGHVGQRDTRHNMKSGEAWRSPAWSSGTSSSPPWSSSR